MLALTRDGRLLLASRAVRSVGHGALATVLGVYLVRLGYREAGAGLLLSLLLVSSALITVWTVKRGDRFGRRKALAMFGGLMMASGALLAFPLHPLVALVVVMFGTISPTGAEVGPFLSIEQALLPQTCDAKDRTSMFSVYNLVGVLSAAGGALLAGAPFILLDVCVDPTLPFRVLFFLFACLGGAAVVLSISMSREVEVDRGAGGVPEVTISPESRRRIGRLASLFAVDSFAGGFVVQSVVALWFHQRFGADPALLGAIFFGAGVLASLSMLAASRIARRIGLVRTAVFTHLPSNLLLILTGLAPVFPLALLFFLARMSLSQMDVPTRQSYIAAIVRPEERTAAAGVTNIARNVAQAASPAPAAWSIGLAGAAMAAPFVAGGVLKIGYDLGLYLSFRHLRADGESAASVRETGPAMR